MVSQKNASQKQCIKCVNLLTDENWNKYDKKASHYICMECRKLQDKKRNTSDINYGKKQLIRYRAIKSAVIHSYGDVCIKCGEDEYAKLTIDGKITSGHTYELLYNQLVNKDGYQVMCYNCCYKNTIYKDRYALRDKKKIMKHYGNKCSECNENALKCLVLSATKKLKYTGARMYRWLIKNNFPDNLEIQVLCINCNCSKISNKKTSLIS